MRAHLVVEIALFKLQSKSYRSHHFELKLVVEIKELHDLRLVGVELESKSERATRVSFLPFEGLGKNARLTTPAGGHSFAHFGATPPGSNSLPTSMDSL